MRAGILQPIPEDALWHAALGSTGRRARLQERHRHSWWRPFAVVRSAAGERLHVSGASDGGLGVMLPLFRLCTSRTMALSQSGALQDPRKLLSSPCAPHAVRVPLRRRPAFW